MLACEKKRNDKIYLLSIIIDKDEKKLIINGNSNYNYITESWSDHYIIVYKDGIVGSDGKKVRFKLDRITGSFGSITSTSNDYKCSITNKTLF